MEFLQCVHSTRLALLPALPSTPCRLKHLLLGFGCHCWVNGRLLLQLCIAWPVVGAAHQLCRRVKVLGGLELCRLFCIIHKHRVLVLGCHANEVQALLEALRFLRGQSNSTNVSASGEDRGKQ